MKPQQWRRSSAGRFLRHLPRLKHVRGTWLHRRLGDRFLAAEIWQPERARFAAGISLGTFFAMMPIPVQMISAALIAFITRVNIPAAIAATWLSNPLTTPLFVYLQYRIGCLLMGQEAWHWQDRNVWELFKSAPLPIVTGAVVTGMIGAIVVYPLALWGWDFVSTRFLHPRRRQESSAE